MARRTYGKHMYAEGIDETIAQLRQLQGDNFKKNAKDAHRLGSIAAADAVRPGAPVRTGRLMASVKPSPTTTMGRVQIGSNARVPYAGAVIFGSPKQHIKPNPFPFEGIERHSADILAAYQRGVDNLINEIGLT